MSLGQRYLSRHHDDSLASTPAVAAYIAQWFQAKRVESLSDENTLLDSLNRDDQTIAKRYLGHGLDQGASSLDTDQTDPLLPRQGPPAAVLAMMKRRDELMKGFDDKQAKTAEQREVVHTLFKDVLSVQDTSYPTLRLALSQASRDEDSELLVFMRAMADRNKAVAYSGTSARAVGCVVPANAELSSPQAVVTLEFGTFSLVGGGQQAVAQGSSLPKAMPASQIPSVEEGPEKLKSLVAQLNGKNMATRVFSCTTSQVQIRSVLRVAAGLRSICLLQSKDLYLVPIWAADRQDMAKSKTKKGQARPGSTASDPELLQLVLVPHKHHPSRTAMDELGKACQSILAAAARDTSHPSQVDAAHLSQLWAAELVVSHMRGLKLSQSGVATNQLDARSRQLMGRALLALEPRWLDSLSCLLHAAGENLYRVLLNYPNLSRSRLALVAVDELYKRCDQLLLHDQYPGNGDDRMAYLERSLRQTGVSPPPPLSIPPALLPNRLQRYLYGGVPGMASPTLSSGSSQSYLDYMTEAESAQWDAYDWKSRAAKGHSWSAVSRVQPRKLRQRRAGQAGGEAGDHPGNAIALLLTLLLLVLLMVLLVLLLLLLVVVVLLLLLLLVVVVLLLLLLVVVVVVVVVVLLLYSVALWSPVLTLGRAESFREALAAPLQAKAEPAAEPTKGTRKGKGKAAKAKPAPQPGRWLDRDCNAALNMQRIGESRWRPLELCFWPDQGALPAKGKEYPGLGYKRLQDKPPKAQQQQQQPAEAQSAHAASRPEREVAPAKRSKRTKAEPAAQPTNLKGTGKGKGKAAKAKPAPQPGRWLDRDCNAALNMQRIGESRWRPLELCFWPDQGALPAKGKEYPGLGYKRLRDKPPKAQQQQPAEAQ
ncbi:hypothetical protein QJQ45_009785 [Haematococcus lacustris]|nr:hypothetical protein QJQ45_009785 [Haematococcus lacustris]